MDDRLVQQLEVAPYLLAKGKLLFGWGEISGPVPYLLSYTLLTTQEATQKKHRLQRVLEPVLPSR